MKAVGFSKTELANTVALLSNWPIVSDTNNYENLKRLKCIRAGMAFLWT